MSRSTPYHTSCDLLPQVRAGIRRTGSIEPGETVIAAVSGGQDSVTLLDLLVRLSEEWRLTVHVAHLNHGLRGAEADRDALTVSKIASNLGLQFYGDRTDVAELAARERRSTEDAARQARLSFLERVRLQTGADRVALGHTRSDQAETVLMRLLRGSGTRGLAGIRPIRDRAWVRPLLDVSRTEVTRYVDWRDLHVCSDKSNTDPAYLRNRIRLDLLPRLKQDYAEGVEETLARTAEILREEDVFLDEIATAYLQKALIYRGKRKIVLDGPSLFRYHIAIRRRLFRNVLQLLDVSGDGLSFSSIRRLSETVSDSRASTQIVPGVRATRCGAGLIFSRATPSFSVPVSVPGRTAIPQLDISVVVQLRSADDVRDGLRTMGPYRSCFDRRALSGELVLRNRCDGDRFRPFGMAGTRKVSDLLIDEKIPQTLRDEVPLLVCENSILWLAGVKRSATGCVGPESRDVVEIAIEGNGCRLGRIRS
jgi:tRNA(Ile)-lysidine synthase